METDQMWHATLFLGLALLPMLAWSAFSGVEMNAPNLPLSPSVVKLDEPDQLNLLHETVTTVVNLDTNFVLEFYCQPTAAAGRWCSFSANNQTLSILYANGSASVTNNHPKFKLVVAPVKIGEWVYIVLIKTTTWYVGLTRRHAMRVVVPRSIETDVLALSVVQVTMTLGSGCSMFGVKLNGFPLYASVVGGVGRVPLDHRLGGTSLGAFNRPGLFYHSEHMIDEQAAWAEAVAAYPTTLATYITAPPIFHLVAKPGFDLLLAIRVFNPKDSHVVTIRNHNAVDDFAIIHLKFIGAQFTLVLGAVTKNLLPGRTSPVQFGETIYIHFTHHSDRILQAETWVELETPIRSQTRILPDLVLSGPITVFPGIPTTAVLLTIKTDNRLIWDAGVDLLAQVNIDAADHQLQAGFSVIKVLLPKKAPTDVWELAFRFKIITPFTAGRTQVAALRGEGSNKITIYVDHQDTLFVLFENNSAHINEEVKLVTNPKFFFATCQLSVLYVSQHLTIRLSQLENTYTVRTFLPQINTIIFQVTTLFFGDIQSLTNTYEPTEKRFSDVTILGVPLYHVLFDNSVFSKSLNSLFLSNVIGVKFELRGTTCTVLRSNLVSLTIEHNQLIAEVGATKFPLNTQIARREIYVMGLSLGAQTHDRTSLIYIAVCNVFSGERWHFQLKTVLPDVREVIITTSAKMCHIYKVVAFSRTIWTE